MMLFLKFVFGICFCMWLYITLTYIEAGIFIYKCVKSFFKDDAFVIVEVPKTKDGQAEMWALVGAQTAFIYAVSSKEKCLEIYGSFDEVKKKLNNSKKNG